MEQIILALTGSPQIPPLILLNPNASDFLPLRRWSLASYYELAKGLLPRFPEAYIAFTGLASEAGPSGELVKQLDSARCFSMAGRTTLRQLLVLYTLARVLVTNDSGPAHFATLTPIQVVSLFGPETPKLFAARSPRTRVVYAGIACSPCINALNNRQSACRNNLCMQTIAFPKCSRKCRSLSKGVRAVFGARFSSLRVMEFGANGAASYARVQHFTSPVSLSRHKSDCHD